MPQTTVSRTQHSLPEAEQQSARLAAPSLLGSSTGGLVPIGRLLSSPDVAAVDPRWSPTSRRPLGSVSLSAVRCQRWSSIKAATRPATPAAAARSGEAGARALSLAVWAFAGAADPGDSGPTEFCVSAHRRGVGFGSDSSSLERKRLLVASSASPAWSVAPLALRLGAWSASGLGRGRGRVVN